jgi:hypothetical protein
VSVALVLVIAIALALQCLIIWFSVKTKPLGAKPYRWATWVGIVSADSGGWRSAFRGDGDRDSEIMPITIPS